MHIKKQLRVFKRYPQRQARGINGLDANKQPEEIKR